MFSMGLSSYHPKRFEQFLFQIETLYSNASTRGCLRAAMLYFFLAISCPLDPIAVERTSNWLDEMLSGDPYFFWVALILSRTPPQPDSTF
jgi:hypothetical protein